MQIGRHLRQRGFGFLLVLFALAAMGLMLAGTGQVWHTAAQREREAELLFVGNQFRNAIGSYYRASAADAARYPARLEDLLEDRRFPVPMRHLRRIYLDPMTGQPSWGLVVAGGRIQGVYSQSQGSSLRTVFDGPDAALTGTVRHDQWVFVHDPSAGP